MMSDELGGALVLTPRFSRAVDYARQIHVGYRKATTIPYMAHLLGVASLVMGESGHVPFPVTEDMAIAALLHDAMEDEGGLPRLHDIEQNFGRELARIVEGCRDSFEEDSEKKQDWATRKRSRSILEDYRNVGAEVWKRFKRGRKEQLWYFNELISVYSENARIGNSSRSSGGR